MCQVFDFITITHIIRIINTFCYSYVVSHACIMVESICTCVHNAVRNAIVYIIESILCHFQKCFSSTVNFNSVFIINFVFCKFIANGTFLFHKYSFLNLIFYLNVQEAPKLCEGTSPISTIISPSLSSTFSFSFCDFVLERMYDS